MSLFNRNIKSFSDNKDPRMAKRALQTRSTFVPNKYDYSSINYTDNLANSNIFRYYGKSFGLSDGSDYNEEIPVFDVKNFNYANYNNDENGYYFNHKGAQVFSAKDRRKYAEGYELMDETQLKEYLINNNQNERDALQKQKEGLMLADPVNGKQEYTFNPETYNGSKYMDVSNDYNARWNLSRFAYQPMILGRSSNDYVDDYVDEKTGSYINNPNIRNQYNDMSINDRINATRDDLFRYEFTKYGNTEDGRNNAITETNRLWDNYLQPMIDSDYTKYVLETGMRTPWIDTDHSGENLEFLNKDRINKVTGKPFTDNDYNNLMRSYEDTWHPQYNNTLNEMLLKGQRGGLVGNAKRGLYSPRNNTFN